MRYCRLLLRPGLEDKCDSCKTVNKTLVATVTGVTMHQGTTENAETCVTHRIPLTTELSTKTSILRHTHLKNKKGKLQLNIKFREDDFLFLFTIPNNNV
jgi:phage FluMu protein Com